MVGRMLSERNARRDGWKPGIAIRLADGESWIFADPVDESSSSSGEFQPNANDPEYEACLTALCDSDGPIDRRRNALALAIHLLNMNYDLRPDQLRRLLSFGPDRRALDEFHQHLAILANFHAAGWRPLDPDSNESHRRTRHHHDSNRIETERFQTMPEFAKLATPASD